MKGKTVQLGKYSYNKEWHNGPFMTFVKKVLCKIALFYDYIWDLIICHCSLVKYVPSIYRESLGGTGSQSSPYWVLDEIFCNITLTENDSFVDVGCGKGRVLAFLLRNKAKCSISGIELNEEVANYAKAWSKRYPNVTVLNENAFEIDYNQFTVLFLFRPFETETFRKFIEKIEQEISHPIRFIYYADTQSGNLLKDRPGWLMKQRNWVWKKYGLYLSMIPQRWSEWTYTPSAKN
ncbi:MAG: class I SAM-dependent methyltransferase [Paludibacteraceae bacterium]|nr:class I SAM-dependent methyltransferase [Paludibacteraceae bacterium]